MRISRLLVLAFTILFVLPVHSQVIEHSKGSYNFFQNKGQWPTQVKYMADIAGGKIWLEKDRVLYHWQDFSGLREAHDHPGDPKQLVLGCSVCLLLLILSFGRGDGGIFGFLIVVGEKVLVCVGSRQQREQRSKSRQCHWLHQVNN